MTSANELLSVARSTAGRKHLSLGRGLNDDEFRAHRPETVTGCCVAVIGSGSSAAQMVPVIAKTAQRARVFQRTPNWVLPKPPAEFGQIRRWAFARAPILHSTYQALIYHGADIVLSPIVSWGWSARPAEWAARAYLRWWIKDSELRTKLTPDYPIGCQRIIVDGAFYPSLTEEMSS